MRRTADSYAVTTTPSLIGTHGGRGDGTLRSEDSRSFVADGSGMHMVIRHRSDLIFDEIADLLARIEP